MITLATSNLLVVTIAGAAGLAVTLGLLGVSGALRIPRAAIPGARRPRPALTRRRLAIRRTAADNAKLFALTLPLIERLGRRLDHDRYASLRAYVAQPYQHAGEPGGLTDAEAAAMAILLGLALGVGFAALGALALGTLGLLVFAPIGLAVGPLAMVTSLQARAALRARRIEALLPYAIDLIVLVLRAGASFNQALKQVVQDHADHPLGEEFGHVLARIELGASRPEALGELADMLDLDPMYVFVDNVIQSEELGWPLADTLERLSDRMAAQRILRAQATAGKSSVAIMMPSSLILIAVILILFGPIIVRAFRGDYAF